MEDIFFLDADLIELALNNLVDQKYFLRKILWREGFVPLQVGISAKDQKCTEKEGEKVTDPIF